MRMVTARRWHGSLDTITDSERRGLRPIETTAREVAARTGVLLGELPAGPGVCIFQGVRPAAAGDLPRIPHAISAGRQLILVESVAWPPGRYHQEADGRIHCDGTYIGQSVLPLVNAVRYWRDALPRGHRVRALVVLSPTAEGDLALPATVAEKLAWTRACDAGNNKCQAIGLAFHVRSPDRIRTGVTALRGRRPRPLDDGAVL